MQKKNVNCTDFWDLLGYCTKGNYYNLIPNAKVTKEWINAMCMIMFFHAFHTLEHPNFIIYL